jgi:hypothetical protein
MFPNFPTRFIAAGAIALALSQVGTAQAAEFEFKFTGTNVSGDVFATTAGSSVTAISGWVIDSEVASGTFTITGLSSYAGADNTFNPASPYFDFAGVSFSTNVGGDYNLFNVGSSSPSGVAMLSSVLDPGGVVQTAGLTNLASLTVTAVPEPASMALLLAGLGMVGVMASRRRASR